MKKHKYLLRVCLFLLLIGIVADIQNTLQGINVVQAEGSDDYKTFTQGGSPWGTNTLGNGSTTIARQGCALTTVTVLMAYANPELRDSSKWNPGVANTKFNFDGACIYWNSTVKADPTFVEVSQSEVGITGVTAQDFKKALEKGYYCMVFAFGINNTDSPHYSPIVGWDNENDKPIVWDVGGNGKTWDDWVRCGIKLSGGMCVHFYKGKLSAKDTILNGNTTMGEMSDALNSDSVIEGRNLTLSEWELYGMPDKNTILGVEQSELILADRANLSVSQQDNLTEMGVNLKLKHSINNTLNVVIMFLALVLVVYSIILFICSICDISNNWIDISLVKSLTLGKCRVVTDDIDESSIKNLDKGEFTPKQWYIRCAIMFLVGSFLLTGVVQGFIGRVLSIVILGRK